MVDRLAEARAALARGDVLVAYDAAQQVVDGDPDDLEARFVVALALARAGSTEHAERAVEDLARRIESTGAASARLREDADALVARLAKDRALAESGSRRQELAALAADLYERAAERSGGIFPYINAATLRVLAGDTERASVLAEKTLGLLAANPTPAGEDAYWHLATQAEAALVLGDVAGAEAALDRAAAAGANDVAARAVTRRQLRFLCEARGIDEAILDVLAPSTVLHYCGHRIDAPGAATRFPAALEGHVAAEIETFLNARRIGVAFGSLANGADILVAEALLERGVELNVVLPFDADEFDRVSVADGGPVWTERYRSCLDRAATVRCACDSAYLDDRELFGYGARVAMGRVINRAVFLGVEAEQLAVWNGHARDHAAGTAHDVAAWQRTGRPTEIIPLEAPATPAPPVPPRAANGQTPRDICAVIFADCRGFSRLRDEQFPAFVDGMLGTLAAVLHRFEDTTVYRNSWGDAIVVVLTDVAAAAACTLEIQEALVDFDFAGAGLPLDLALRMGAHVGPVMPITDPIRAQLTYWGRELTRAARIEPRTPEGDVYVTDAFAALLALEPTSKFATEYVGLVTTAKQFETIPMYRLRRA